jgi:hypothetical protein
LVDPAYFIERVDNLRILEVPFLILRWMKSSKTYPTISHQYLMASTMNSTKKCWDIIKLDFYRLCGAFYENIACLRSINSSQITLIPKVDSPMTVSDYRPISLLNSSVKLLTKILANRLQPVITKLIHKNQYGFIQSRIIKSI